MSDHRSGDNRGSHSRRPRSGSYGRNTGGFNGQRRNSDGRGYNRSGRPGRWEDDDRRNDCSNSRHGQYRRGDDDNRPRRGNQDRRNDWRQDRRDDRSGGRRDSRGDRENRRNDWRGDGRDIRDDRRNGGDRRNNRAGFRSNRGGSDRQRTSSGPQRPGYREERLNKRLNEIPVPADIDPKDLDPSVRQELRSLSKDNADMVAKHLIMSATLLDQDPEQALAHARAAKDRAGRVAVARETCGIAAYHAGEWKEAISELRAARRMSGGPGLLAVLADAERGLGRPTKAIEVANDEQVSELDAESRVELAIVVAGAYQDLDRGDESLETLRAELAREDAPEVTRMRLFYAYGDALEANGRGNEAEEWFRKAAALDTEDLLDTDERLEALATPADSAEAPTPAVTGDNADEEA